ncbi:MAG: hypothetical protein ACJAT4_000226 [Granulosicoccus sp.]|jgi:hypothetical protein
MNKLQSEINPQQVVESIDNSLVAIEKFDFEKLSKEEREEIFNQLTTIEKLALELKAKIAG